MLQGYLPSILEGAIVTLTVALSSLVIAVLLGLLGAAMKLSKSRTAKFIATVYTTVIRGVPDLVLMLLIFYGGQLAINELAPKLGYADYIDINPFIAGVMTIGFIFGAYLTETFRGAIMAIPAGQREAGIAYGMSNGQVFRRIVFPQMVRFALPGFTNNWLVLVKSTALVSIIGLSDMMNRAGMAAGATREPFTFYMTVAVLYLVITSVSNLLLGALQKRYSLGVRTASL
ncbi:MAG: ABC transporter permease [Betaproteobacteria bacterium]|nr:ABC transporter permease [Betaproteobacteria bacterium]